MKLHAPFAYKSLSILYLPFAVIRFATNVLMSHCSLDQIALSVASTSKTLNWFLANISKNS
jgi:hypothetical protein